LPKAEKKKVKVKDKWREKVWYNIVAPSYFGGNTVAFAPSSDPVEMAHRSVETTLYDVTGDFSQQHIKLYFHAREIKGTKVETIFKGHEYSRDYLRSLVRRGSTRVEGALKISTSDGYQMRVSAVAFTVSRIKQAQAHAIRQIMRNIIEAKADALRFDQFIQEAVLGKIASEIYNESKKIVPLRHVGVRKTKLLLMPTGEKIQEETEAESESESEAESESKEELQEE
jgi:small subunit ribosomal protein S3Ae